MRRRSTALRAVGVLIIVVGTGCTRSASPVGAPSASTEPSATPPVVLGCDDAAKTYTSEPAATDLVFAGARFTRLTDPAGGGSSVRAAVDAGLDLPPSMSDWQFRKAPVELAAGGPPVTVRLDADVEGAALAWVPFQAWTSGTRPDLTARLATTVTFQGCPDRPVLYLGGLLAASGATCLPLVLSAAGEEQRVVRRLDGASCA